MPIKERNGGTIIHFQERKWNWIMEHEKNELDMLHVPLFLSSFQKKEKPYGKGQIYLP